MDAKDRVIKSIFPAQFAWFSLDCDLFIHSPYLQPTFKA